MEHQDWNAVTFNNSEYKQKLLANKERSNSVSRKQFNSETTKLEAPKNLGQLIAQARTAKGVNQENLAKQSGIAKQVLNKWETNKETPNNSEIAKLEKILGVKLPRCKKTKISEDD